MKIHISDNLRAVPQSILPWFERNQRDLPWRHNHDPYRILLSEIMLQQTQVAVVIPFFHRFINVFPTVSTLADAPLQQVLALWQGMGYYRRARNLHACAQAVMQHHNGAIPDTVNDLLSLPGIGRYTAGAIASIAFGRQDAAVDGNVGRVLARLLALRKPTDAELWKVAGQLVPANRPGDYNAAMMELGAIVCTPKSPKCQTCPLQQVCLSHERGLENKIPAPKAATKQPLVSAITVIATSNDRWLLEQRPASGRWGGMWQFPTVERDGRIPRSWRIESLLNLPGGESVQRLGKVTHLLTHRRYEFEAYLAAGVPELSTPLQRWVDADNLPNFGMPRPQQKMLQMAQQRLAAIANES